MAAFDRDWFNRNQGWLVHFAKSWIGRIFFRLNHTWRFPRGKLLVAISPDSTTWIEGMLEDGRLCFGTNFLSSDWYSARIKAFLMPILLPLHFLDWLLFDRFPELGFSFGCSSATVNASFPGLVYRSVSSPYESWAEISGGNGTGESHSGNMNVILGATSTANKYSSFERARARFLTGTTLAGKMILSGTINVTYVSKQNASGEPDLHFTPCFPGDPSTYLVAADYQNAFASSVDLAVPIAYADFDGGEQAALTGHGKNYVNQTPSGGTDIGYRIDVGWAPVWTGGGNTGFSFERTGAGQPSLTVVYTTTEEYIGGAGGPEGAGTGISRGIGLTRWPPGIKRFFQPALLLNIYKRK
jgi:hypothetical protein